MATLESKLKLSLIDQVTARARTINGALNSIKATQSSMVGMFGRVAAFGGAYLGVTKGIQSTAGAAIGFESAFADVRKVFNGTEEQIENARRSIIAMSRELPIAASGIAEIYAAAAQSHIPIHELKRFTEMAAKVSTAWDVPVAETSQALAEIKNQLHLSVEGVGLFADSLNHLSNNSSARAPNLLEYTRRVAATGEMFGFSAQETLAFGGSMIAAGGAAEVAATSFRNMGRALTIGERATKSHNTAFGKLGLDSVKTAKSMQKNALKTTIDVLNRIQKLPEWERASIASALFGDEARALMPVINNSSELRRQLGLIGDQANYAGSSFEEYAKRADTVGNVLSILKNKFADTFRADSLLAPIKEAALGVGDILDTLGERGHIFAQMDAAFKGFSNGMGLEGGIREAVNDLGDMLFGKVDGSGAADQIGRIFVKFKDWGQSIRELNDAIKENPIAKFFGGLAPYAGQFILWSMGFAALASTVRKLAAAVWLLSGASAAVGVIKALGGLADVASGGTFPKPGGKKGGTPTKSTPSVPAADVSYWAALATWFKGLTVAGAPALAGEALSATPGSTFEEQVENQKKYREGLQKLLGLNPDESGVSPWKRFWLGDAANPDFSAKDHFAINTGGSRAEPVRIDASSIAEMMRPRATQDVRVTNPQMPNVIVNAPVTIHEASNPQAVANAIGDAIGQKTRDVLQSQYSD